MTASMRDEYDDDLDTEIDDAEYEGAHRRGELDSYRGGCVLGSVCLNPNIIHTAAECYTAELMEAYYADVEESDRQ